MNKILRTVQILLVSILFSCAEKHLPEDRSLYFDEHELSDDDQKGASHNRYFTNALKAFKERSLKDTSNRNETIRLTVFPSFRSNYCVKLVKVKSLYIVSYKTGIDQRVGLNDLILNYKSDSHWMDSIYTLLAKKVDAFNIFAQDNLTPEIIIQNKIVAVDGTSFLLEYYKDGRYVALVRWDCFLDEKFYKNSDEFKEIISDMQSLIPPGLLPDFARARKIEDIRFPVFKKNNRRNSLQKRNDR